MKVLILGQGSIGKKHAENARRQGADVVTVDPDERTGAEFRSVDDPFSRLHDCTHAVIATPVESHYQDMCDVSHVLDVKKILVEKPLICPTATEMGAFPYTTVATEAMIFVGLNWRLNTTIQELRRLVQSGELGEVQYARFEAREDLPKYADDILLHSGSHILDTVRFILGDYEIHHASNAGWASTMIGDTGKAHIAIHINAVNADRYDYQILIQGSRKTVQLQIDRHEPMHLKEMAAFLSGKYGPLATLDDGIANMRLLCQALGGRVAA